MRPLGLVREGRLRGDIIALIFEKEFEMKVRGSEEVSECRREGG